MKFIFIAAIFVVLCTQMVSEQLNMFITKVKVADKNSSNKDWDTFKGAPDIQITISKKQNETWEKCYTSQVYTNHYSVEEEIAVDVAFSLGDEIMIEIVDRDFRNNDAIGSQIISLSEGDLEDTTSFSMVEIFSYVITRYASLEERKKAIENTKWLELEKKKQQEEERKQKEKDKWQEQKDSEKNQLQKEIEKTKEMIMQDFLQELENRRQQAEEETMQSKKQAKEEIAQLKRQVEEEILAKKQKANAEIKTENEKAALERLALKQTEMKEIESLTAKRKKLAADLEYEQAQNKKQTTEWKDSFESMKKEEQSKLSTWKNSEKNKISDELSTWKNSEKNKISDELSTWKNSEKNKISDELSTWKNSEKNKISDELSTWKNSEKNKISDELSTWKNSEKNKISDELSTWKNSEKTRSPMNFLPGKNSEKEKMLTELKKESTPKAKPVLFKGADPKPMNPEQLARAVRALELTFRHVDKGSSRTHPERNIENLYEGLVEVTQEFTRAYKQLEYVAKHK